MARKIPGSFTVRITDGEILESQLSDDDISGLVKFANNGGNGNGVKCHGGYCKEVYEDEVMQEAPPTDREVPTEPDSANPNQ